MLGSVNLKSVYINADIGVNLLQADHNKSFSYCHLLIERKKKYLEY